MIQKVIALLMIALFCTLSMAECAGWTTADSKRGESVSESEAAETEDTEESDSSEENALLAEKASFYSEDGTLLCGISLTAEQTQYFVGDEGILTLTISLPRYVLESAGDSNVRLENETGAQIGMYALSDFSEDANGYYSSTHSFEFDTDTNMTFGLKVFCGEYYSPWLVITVTPEITADQIADCAVIGTELNEAMAEGCADVSARKRAEAAKEWLEEDERILEAYLPDEDDVVYYVTTDYVSGAFNAAGIEESDDPAEDISGINDGSSTDFVEDSFLTDLYNEYGNSQIEKNNVPLYVATTGSGVSTDPDALLLVPCPDDMGTGRTSYIKSFTDDLTAYTHATGGNVTILTGMDAIEAFFNHSLNEYGMVTLFTHGTIMDGQFMRNKHNKQTLYLMYRSDAFSDDTKEAIHESAKDKLKEFAQTAYSLDAQGKNSEKSFYSQWYGEPGTLSLAGYTRKMILTTVFSTSGNQYEIWMSSTFFADRYQNQRFDNTVFYLAACKGLLDSEFDGWLLNRGCRYVFGFTVTVRTIANVNYHNELLRLMTEQVNDHPNRFRVVQEATEEIGVVDAAAWNLDDTNAWFSWIGPLAISYSQDVPSGSVNNTLYYVGENDFTFKGHGELKGHVKWKDPDADSSDESEENAEPVAGAEVTAYVLRNRTFAEFEGNVVTTDENGEFVIPECPFGYLIFVAEKGSVKSDPYQACFVDDEKDGGNLFIPKPEGMVPSACIGSYKGQIYKLGSTVAELEGLPVEAAKYDYICSFAFYNGKVYYCCKESGTSDYYMALYEADPDGSNQRELYDPKNYNSSLNRFVLADGCLYYAEGSWAGSTWVNDYYQINLADGVRSACPDAPEEVKYMLGQSYGYFTYGNLNFYTNYDSKAHSSSQIYMRKEDGSTETLVTTEKMVRLEGVARSGVTGDPCAYYSTFSGSGQEAQLYRLNLNTRQTEMIDSHMAAGGGIYFNW